MNEKRQVMTSGVSLKRIWLILLFLSGFSLEGICANTNSAPAIVVTNASVSVADASTNSLAAKPVKKSFFKRSSLSLNKQVKLQQKQLDEQSDQLKKLSQQLEDMQGSSILDPTVQTNAMVISSSPKKKDPAEQETRRWNQNEWQGKWKDVVRTGDTHTHVSIGGYARLNVVHDSDAITSPGAFVTANIVTRDAHRTDGAGGRSSMDVNPSRVHIQTISPVNKHDVHIYLSADLKGDSLSASPHLRARQVYGEISDIILGGDLLFGQTWSTFSARDAFPNTLDTAGPPSEFSYRVPLMRWSKDITSGFTLMTALESTQKHNIEGADSQSRWPDGVVSFRWHNELYKFMGSVVARDLRASYNDEPVQSIFGWGTSISGALRPTYLNGLDVITFSVTYGHGIGGALGDSPPDATFNPNQNQLETLPSLGYFVSYEHWWNKTLGSTCVYGAVDVKNRSYQADESLNETQYASCNLVWSPNKVWFIGMEGLWGQRKDKDNVSADVFRMLMTTQFNF